MKLKTLIPLIGLITLSLHTQSCAQTNAANRKFSEHHGTAVNKALQAINAEDHHTALAILDKTLEEHPDLNPYERSIIYQMQGSSYYELKQETQAIQAFEAAIAAIHAGGMSEEDFNILCINPAKMLIANHQYQRAAELLEQCSRDGNEVKHKYVEFIMQALVQAEDYERALPYAERWYNEANPKERKHYDLMNFLYHNLGHPDKQTAIVKDMIGRWPEDKVLRDTLASIHAKQERE